MKVLAVGNSVLSDEESNGRITRLLLGAFKNEELYSFGLRGIPNCKGIDYKVVTDKDALNAFVTLGIRKAKGELPAAGQAASRDSRSTKPIGHILRDIVWFSGLWRNKTIRKWEKSLDIGAVFLMAADAPFLYRYSRKIAKRKNVPLVIYTSEDYPLKQYDYMSKKIKMSLFCRIFLSKLKREAKKAFEFAKASIFVCEESERDFGKAFHLKNTYVIKQPGRAMPFKYVAGKEIKKIIYAGNINKERLASLLDLSKIIKIISPDAEVAFYGPISDEWSKQLIESNGLIKYGGKVSYDDLLKIYAGADLLLHAEGFSDFNRLDYAHSFSTKIGDCYLTGIPFFMYGPQDVPCIAFGYKVTPQLTASSFDEAKEKLENIFSGRLEHKIGGDIIHSFFDSKEIGHKIKKIIEK